MSVNAAIGAANVGQAGYLGVLLDGRIVVGNVRLMVLLVMQLHDLACSDRAG
jgi:hypothetical protein